MMSQDDTDLPSEKVGLPPVNFSPRRRRHSLQPTHSSSLPGIGTKLPTIEQGVVHINSPPRTSNKGLTRQRSRAELCKSPSCPQLFFNLCSTPNSNGENTPVSGRSSIKLPDIHSGFASPRNGTSKTPTFKGELDDLYEKVKRLQNRNGNNRSDGDSFTFSPPSSQQTSPHERAHTHPGILGSSHHIKPLYRRINSQPVLLLPIRTKEVKPKKKHARLKKKVSQMSIFDSSDHFQELENDYAKIDVNGSISMSNGVDNEYDDDEISSWPVKQYDEESSLNQSLKGFDLGSGSGEETDGSNTPSSLDQEDVIHLEETETNEGHPDLYPEHDHETPWVELEVKEGTVVESDQSENNENNVSSGYNSQDLALPEVGVADLQQATTENLVDFDDLSNIKCKYDDHDDFNGLNEEINQDNYENQVEDVVTGVLNIICGGDGVDDDADDDVDADDDERHSTSFGVRGNEWLEDIDLELNEDGGNHVTEQGQKQTIIESEGNRVNVDN